MTYSDSYPTALSKTSFEMAIRAASVLRLEMSHTSKRRLAFLAARAVFCRCIDCSCEENQCERCPIFDAVIAEVERRLRFRSGRDGAMATQNEPTSKMPHCQSRRIAPGENSARPNSQCAVQDTP